jgi:hypothetical protein
MTFVQDRGPLNSDANPFADIAAARSVLSILRPLTEGMALYAEFDAMSRPSSQVQSQLMNGLMACYSRPEDWNFEIPEDVRATLAIGAVLSRFRLTPEAIRRKASILVRPLDPAQDPYLLGYLTVKSMWRTLVARVPGLASETDLFLMYLRSFFFDDPGLLSAILDRDFDERERCRGVLRHLVSRVETLDQVGLDDVKAFEEYAGSDVASAPNTLGSPIPGMKVSESAWAKAGASLEAETEYALRIASDPDLRYIGRWLISVLNQRQYATLVSADVVIERPVEGDVIARYEDEVLMTLAPEDLVPGDDVLGQVEVEILLDMARFSRVAVFTRNGRAVAIKPLWVSDRAEIIRDDARQWYRQQASFAEVETSMRKMDDFLLQKGSPSAAAIDEIDALLLPFWTDVAFRYARDWEAVDNCAEIMRDRGFYPLLKDSRLLRQFALLGLCLSLNVGEANLRAVLSKHGAELDTLLPQLQDVHREWGFPLPPELAGGLAISWI